MLVEGCSIMTKKGCDMLLHIDACHQIIGVVCRQCLPTEKRFNILNTEQKNSTMIINAGTYVQYAELPFDRQFAID